MLVDGVHVGCKSQTNLFLAQTHTTLASALAQCWKGRSACTKACQISAEYKATGHAQSHPMRLFMCCRWCTMQNIGYAQFSSDTAAHVLQVLNNAK